MLPQFATSGVRSVLRLLDGAEHELAHRGELEERLQDAVIVLHRTADSLERHVVVLEGLAVSLPALTDAVARLSGQLTELIALAAPLEAAEREVTGLGRLFHRRRAADPQP
jgi:hypothetical protein